MSKAATTKGANKMAKVIGFRNNNGKVHTNARCGHTLKNRIINTPIVISTDDTEIEMCLRCGGKEMAPLTKENLITAWTATTRVSGRSFSDNGWLTHVRKQIKSAIN